MQVNMWLGDEASYQEVIRAREQAVTQVSLGSSNSEDFNPYEDGMLSVHEGIGIINISGSLVTNGSWLSRRFGVTGYSDIKDTLVVAAQDPEIHHILLNIDSSGGSANGIDSVATLIKQINSDYKPVTAFTEGKANSAAYWIGSAAGAFYGTRLSEVGSIGVIAILVEQTKALEMEGITPTVFRSGEFKAFGNSMEVLSDKAKAKIQSRLDTLYGEFVHGVATARGLPESSAKSTWAEGRTFLGFEAVKENLLDGVKTFEEVTSKLRKATALTSADGKHFKMEGSDVARQKVLSEQAAAIIALGGELPDEIELGSPKKGDDDGDEGDQTSKSDADGDDDGDGTDSKGKDESKDESKAKKGDEKKVESSDLTAFLQTELSTVRESVLVLTLENRELKAKLDSQNVTHEKLRSIACDTINLRHIGLGHRTTDMSTMSDEVLIQSYNQITTEFNAKYPVGGVTEAYSVEQEQAHTSVQESRRIKATKAKI
jgi:signal peptide peptidase SppA